VDETLAGSQPAADRTARAEPPPFEREEPHDGLAFRENGDSGAGPEMADDHRELR